MIQLLKTYKKLQRDIDALSSVLLVFLVGLLARAVYLIYQGDFQELWKLTGSITSLVAALLVVKTAEHLIANGEIAREDQRRLDLVRVTHHLLAITKDLQSKVAYLRHVLDGGGRSSFEFAQITESIERRYEALFDREAYKFLPGKCVDLIGKISGSIYGIAKLGAAVKQQTDDKPFVAVASVLTDGVLQKGVVLDALLLEIQELMDGIAEVRASIDGVRPEKGPV